MDTNYSTTRVLFTLIKNNPGLSMYDIHAAMKTNPGYKPGSGAATVYKMLKDKQIARDKRRAFFAVASEYTPIPKAKPVKAKPVKAKPADVKPADVKPADAAIAQRGLLMELTNKPVSVPLAFAMSVGSFLASRYL